MSDMLIVDLVCQKIFLIIGEDTNCHTLFIIGLIASDANLSDRFVNSFSQKSLITGSVVCANTSFLKVLSVSIFIICKKFA